MRKTKLIIGMFGLLALTACSDSDDSSNQPPPSSVDLTITAVDPYIAEAVFCIDENLDNACGANEPVSSAGTVEGQYVFNNYTVSSATQVLAKQNGKHNGVDFDLALKAKVSAGTTHAILNPATTILADKGITADDLVAILNQFAYTTPGLGLDASDLISAEELSADPLAGLLDKDISLLTTHEIALIRAQVVLAGMEKVASGSDVISGLTASQFIASATQGEVDGDAIYHIINAMMTGVCSISSDLLNSMAGTLNGYETSYSVSLPDISVRDVLNTAIAIMNRVSEVGYTACNSYNQSHTGTNYSVSDNILAVQTAINTLNPSSQIPTWANSLGQRYYGANHQSALTAYQAYLPSDVQAGVSATNGHFKINASNQVEEVQ